MGIATMKRLCSWLVVACAAVTLPTASHAATINLNMDNMDAVYNGLAGLLHDINSDSDSLGGTQSPAKANPLNATTVTLEGAVVDQFTVLDGDEIYGDLLVRNLPNSITAPDLANSPPGPVTVVLGDNDFDFGFEWFVRDGGSTVSSLSLDFDEVIVTLTDTGADDPSLTVNASTTQWEQFNLPGGLVFDPGTRLRFSYTSQNTAAAPVDGQMYTNVIGMEGVVSISGEGGVIPEPTAGFLMLGALAAGAVATRWRLG